MKILAKVLLFIGVIFIVVGGGILSLILSHYSLPEKCFLIGLIFLGLTLLVYFVDILGDL